MKTFNEWLERNTHGKQFFPSMLKEDYDEGDILHFWYLFNQDSPAVKKFILGLSALMDECFPEERKYAETIERDDFPIAHRYICVKHESDK